MITTVFICAALLNVAPSDGVAAAKRWTVDVAALPLDELERVLGDDQALIAVAGDGTFTFAGGILIPITSRLIVRCRCIEEMILLK